MESSEISRHRFARRLVACTCVAVCTCTTIIEQSDFCSGPPRISISCPLAVQPLVDAPSGNHGSGPLSNGTLTLTTLSTGATGYTGYTGATGYTGPTGA
jgi:hypothetical protein